ncbi:MAG TPA: prolipoprotein diacylglyceryl transferase family protein [Dongiaceae bacterium]|nr:prolipoprotein diacylglyceryl transferase family protein [Dongiaceae bacterium]
MTFPVYLHIGAVKIHPHFLFEALAYGVGFRLYVELRKSRGDFLDTPRRWWVVAAATTGALVGAVLLAMLENPARLVTQWREPRTLLAGKTIVGALIGGTFAVEWIKRRLDIRQKTGDLFALPLCVGIAVGRIGCFLTGLPDRTYGTASSLPWGVDFGDGVRRHPTQLYEVVFLVLLAVALARLWRLPYLRGDLYKLFMVSYLSFRLVIDFLKPEPRVLLGMSSIQWACVAMLIYYRADIVRWMKRGGLAYERVETKEGYQVREPTRVDR